MDYELHYGTVHCTGRFSYAAGRVSSKAAATAWCGRSTGAADPETPVPDTDPLRWCPVRHCHMKRQRPWRSYRPVAAADPEEKT